MLRNNKSSNLRYIILLAIIVAILYGPSLWKGRMMDDFMILEKCEKLPLTTLLSEGLKADREELGDFWWIEQKTIFHYFRPLLVFTFWLPIQLSNNSDFAQHLINLFLHLLTAGLLFELGKRLFQETRAAFLSVLLFTVSTHHLLAVQWIAARKELLTGALLILAFYLHTKKRLPWAALAYMGALLSGEHAAIFPVLVLLWDLINRKSKIRSFWRSWLVYSGILVCYMLIRAAVLGGFPVPASPYYQTVFQSRFLVYILLKFAGFFFSLTSSVPYAVRWIIWEWQNNPLLMGGCFTITLGFLFFLIKASKKRSDCLAFLLLAMVSFIPFVFLEGLPYYLYTPYVFFALAVGASLSKDSKVFANHVRKFLPAVVILTILINFGAGMAFNWSSFGNFLKVPPDQLSKLAKILEKEPGDRPVFFIDLPNSFPVPYFHFINSLATKTGREPRTMAIISAKRDNTSGNLSKARPLGGSRFLIERVKRPYFDTALRNTPWLFPEGIAVEDKTFLRPFYRVTIKSIPEKNASSSRAQRFLSRDRGIKSLEIEFSEEIPPPLIIGFDGKDPLILLDMKNASSKRKLSSPGNIGVDYLLHRLADSKGIPPRALVRPESVIPGAGSKPGIGPLFDKMILQDPVFRRAYYSFLRYADELNTKIAKAGGGPFSMQAAMYGSEEYARSIETIGGKSDVRLTSNAFGVSWDTVMDKARDFAEKSLSTEKLDMTAEEQEELHNLLALAQLAALSNRVMPDDYLADWEKLHPDRLKPPPNPPPGVFGRLWQGVCESIPWMYHAGALPWNKFPADNPHMAFDFFHFFSHAWIVGYNLYREKHFLGSEMTSEVLHSKIRASIRSSFGHEIFTLIAKQGFLELTPSEYLPNKLYRIAERLGFRGIPGVEALRDIQVGINGAIYGAALAISRQRLKPGDRAIHRYFIQYP